MMGQIREMAEEAKTVGLAVVVWSYPRGGNLGKEAETAVDICAYAAHMAALLGAHIIKRSEKHTSELQSLMRTSYAVFCSKKKKIINNKSIHDEIASKYLTSLYHNSNL